MKKYILSLFVFGLLFFVASSINAQTMLSVGSRGDEVKELQEVLIEKGLLAPGYATGYFGSLTFAAVKEFQIQNNMTVTGTVDEKTPITITPSLISSLPDGCNSYAGFSTTTGMPCFVDSISIIPVNDISVTLNGYLFGYAPTKVNFKYHEVKPYADTIDTPDQEMNNTGAFSYTLSALSPDTEYSFSACATYFASGSNHCSKSISFKTGSSTPIGVPPLPAGCTSAQGYSPTTGLPCFPTPTISSPSITVISPNGGETFTTENQIPIRWNASGLNTVYVSITTNDYLGLQTCFTEQVSASQGFSTYTAMRTCTGNKIKIHITGGSSDNIVYDDSDNYFTISSLIVDQNLPPGCTSTQGYSTTTGLACDGSQTITFPPGCTSAQGYSTTTGLACDGSQTITFPLPPGCNSTQGYSSTTGQACNVS